MGTKKILVIDYDQAVLASLHKILCDKGYQVILAADGKSGWEKFEQESPDLVLTEAMLSKIHGFELCEKITKSSGKKVPVFIMTGVYRDSVYRTEALRTYGASEYFEKPLKMPDVLAAIRTALGGRAGFPVEEDGSEMELPKARPTNGGTPKIEIPVPDVRSVANPKPASPGNGGRTPAAVPQKPAGREATGPARSAEGRVKAKNSLDLNFVTKETLTRPPAPKPDGLPKRTAQTHPTAKSVFPENLLEKSRDAGRAAEKKEVAGKEVDLLLASTLADFNLGPDKKKPGEKPKPVPVPSLAGRTGALPNILGIYERPKPAHSVPGQKPAPAPAPPASKADRTPGLKAQTTEKVPAPQQAPVVPPGKTSPSSTAPSAPSAAAHPESKLRPALNETRNEDWPTKEEFAQAAALEAEKPSRLFTDIYEPEKKKTSTLTMGIGATVIVLAAAAFLFLKPKHVPSSQEMNVASGQAQTATSDVQPQDPAPVKSEEKIKPPAPKPKAAKPIAQPTAPAAEEAILPPQIAGAASAIIPALSETKAAPKPEETKPMETPAQGLDGQTAGNPAAVAAKPDPAPASGLPAKAKAGDLVALEAVDVQPRALMTVNPTYPAQAQKFGLEGSVTVNALINENGDVISTGILKGLKDDGGLEKAAEAAVRKWKFQPAVKDGVNVKVWKAFAINFKAKGANPTGE